MPSFLVDPADLTGDHAVLGNEEAHHLKVRRYREGDRIDVIDGRGGFFEVLIERIGRDTVEGVILTRQVDRGECDVQLHLAAAVMKGHQRFDGLVEKVIEIGVASIRPMATDRGVALKSGRTDRWKRLAQGAAKQCGRSRVPYVCDVTSFASALSALRECCDLVMVASPRSSTHPYKATRPSGNLAVVGLLVGPEGGFTSEEEEAAVAAGAEPFTWGERTLRSDTAAIVLSALVLSWCSDRSQVAAIAG